MLNVELDVNLDRDRAVIYNQYLTRKKEKSLAKSFPKLSEEWNYFRNGELTPELVTSYSNKKVWWLGQCGHEWQATISSRVSGHGCPICNSNRLLPGYNDLVTLYPDLYLMYDETKNESPASKISPLKQLSLYWKCKNGHTFKRNLKTMIKHYDSLDKMCPICNQSNVVSDTSNGNIKGIKNPKWRKSALFTLNLSNPKDILDWDYEKNTILPNEITLGSKKKVWWKCSKGHSYKANPNNHIVLHRGCPYCSNHKVLEGFNDLETWCIKNNREYLLNEWDYDKNDITPKQISPQNSKKVWWKCLKCRHEWQAVIYSRTKGHGCPFCSGNDKKKVYNIDTNELFKSLEDAAKSCGLKQGDTISACCRGKQKTAGGYHWKFYEEEGEENNE